MREILFRGKRTDNKLWVTGYFCGDYLEPENPYIITPKGRIRVAHKTIGQYTGLTDKNGRKIFEGDRVKACPLTGTVEFHKSCFSVLWDKDAYGRNFVGYLSEILEVIGNIHDDPPEGVGYAQT